MVRTGFEPATDGFQIRRSNHSATLPPKRRLHDRKTEHFRALTQDCHASALAEHVISTCHNIKWDHFEIIATGKSDLQCKVKETLLISELKLQF